MAGATITKPKKISGSRNTCYNSIDCYAWRNPPPSHIQKMNRRDFLKAEMNYISKKENIAFRKKQFSDRHKEQAEGYRCALVSLDDSHCFHTRASDEKNADSRWLNCSNSPPSSVSTCTTRRDANLLSMVCHMPIVSASLCFTLAVFHHHYQLCPELVQQNTLPRNESKEGLYLLRVES